MTVSLLLVDDERTQFNFDELAQRFPLAANSANIAKWPQARVYNSANISHTTSGSWQAITFNSERYDTGSLHDTGSNTDRLTVTTPGLYVVYATVAFAANSSADRGLRIKHNTSGGTVTIIAEDEKRATSAGFTQLNLCTEFRAAAGDYFTVESNQSTGGALNMLVGSSSNVGIEFGASWKTP